MRRANVLVTGGGGVLARALREFLPDAHYLSHAECDVRDDRHLEAVLRACGARTLLHAAALTNHQHPNAAEIIDVNIEGTRVAAQVAIRAEVRFAYLSTHYVYPGQVGGYTESSVPAPIGVYAMSKLAGESWARTAASWLIVRGSWYTPERVALWARQGAISDAWGSREPVRSAARKIAALVTNSARGTYNIGSARQTFADIALGPHRGARTITRAEVAATWNLPYAFPRDVSVDTAKFDAWWDRMYTVAPERDGDATGDCGVGEGGETPGAGEPTP